jgi:hypothetical protein
MTTTETGVQTNELTEDEKLVVAITTDYKTDKGNTDWKRAWAEHPDWQQKLCAVEEGKQTPRYALVALSLKHRGMIESFKRAKAVRQTAPKKKTGRKLVTLQPQWQKLLDVMLEHGDDSGEVDWKKLDAEQPGWDNAIAERRELSLAASRFRRSGRFKAEKKAMLRQSTGAKHQKTSTNGIAGAAPQRGPLTEEAVEAVMNLAAYETLKLILAECRLLRKAGKPYEASIRLESGAVRIISRL